jgi:asparagine synthase (glutamine-hydrolysing)
MRCNIGALAHRGPDAEGIWRTPALEVGLAHRRLAIIDISDQGKQPMSSPEGDTVLVFNGNIYNYIELREELQTLGVTFRSTSDTEVLLQAYRAWGEHFVQRLFGFFAFAIWDERERRLLIGRDRLGEKPLYYTCDSQSVVFSSEPQALPKTGIDRTSFADFLVYGFVPSPKTLWSNIHKLEPAHLLRVDMGSDRLTTRCWRYWQPRIGWTDLRTDGQMLEGLDHYCREAAEKTTRSDVSLGCLLNGDADSSGMVGLVAKASPRPVHTYAVGFESSDRDDLFWARKVADHYHTIHREIECRLDDPEMFFPRMNRIYGEPFDDTSQVACVSAFKAVAHYSKAILTSDGADELFCGYAKYPRIKRMLLLRSAFPQWLWRGVLGSIHYCLKPGSALEIRLYQAIASNRELMCELSASGVRPCELRDLLTPDLADYDPRIHIENRLRDAEKLAPLDQLRYLDVAFKLAEQMLFKVDHASMAASVEARAFYLYHPLVEFVLSLPADRLIHKDGKNLFKRYLESHVPKENPYRTKRGFGLERAQHGSWLDPAMQNHLHEMMGVSYGRTLAHGDPESVKRLRFGARSLHEWLLTQKTTLHQALNFPPESMG